ncbi:YbaB/EbfC family nucleoid-associated protein [Micromonospora olivasterospora]|uniref:DNA-binding protein YbaB n=1 Tax=Micromonospora olivasterospora TaxID=1880 RepID=A0A562IBD5_MICOL|nr:YbaB/EbfC family nucleoid-associated protein [Micromonospora olivasterospora]TWH67944.1 DNA-binding protein YbaB [Micromonospora olivasterospora]
MDNSQELDRALRMSQELQRKAEAFQSRLSEVTGQGSDDSGLVQVSVGLSGGLSDVYVDPRAMRLASQDLADAFKHAHQAATQDMQNRLMEAQREAFGDDLLSGMLDGSRSPDELLGDMRRTTEAGLDASLDEIERLRRRLS